MLHHDSRRTICRECGQNFEQGFNASSRGTNRDNSSAVLVAGKRADRTHGFPRGLARTNPGGGGGLNNLRKIREGLRASRRRFLETFDRAGFQRTDGLVGAFARKSGNHHHRHRVGLHDVAEEGQPVDVRQHDVERDDVGIQRAYGVAPFCGVRGLAHHFDVGIRLQRGGNDRTHHTVIVDDDDADRVA